jgi:arabinose-5-phosphate isomerase
MAESAVKCDVIGIGSVVLDRIYQADRILGAESKGMVRGVQEFVGGVVLNHLAWAQVLGLQAGLFGRQGDDKPGATIRAYLDRIGMDRSLLRTDGEGSSTANIFVDPDGERCIYMHRAATETTTPEHVSALFTDYIQAAGRLTTEISQLPLPTVVRALRIAAEAGVPTVLDVDIPPSQAVGEAGLGTMAQLREAMSLATCIKPAGSAIGELYPGRSLEAVARLILDEHPRTELVAITDGPRGCVLASRDETIRVPAAAAERVIDTTGAGDAFLGGLLVGLHRGLPLMALGQLANACGAACVEQLGATPDPVAGLDRVRTLCPEVALAEGATEAGAAPPAPGAQALDVIQGELQGWHQGFPPTRLDQAAEAICAAMAAGGRVHVTGVGKPEHVAHYGASILSSLGTPATFLHATECVHGSAGQVLPGDIVIAISNSGKTVELLAAVQTVRANGAAIFAITSRDDSPLGMLADVVLPAAVAKEGSQMGLAPLASVVVQTAILAALAAELEERHSLTPEQYARFHPGGTLGVKARGA